MALPILSVAQMRQWEAATWSAGIQEADVIANVGRLLARRLLELTRPGERLLLLAGRGHNGDDVRATVPHLDGRDLECLDVREPETALPRLHEALGKCPRLIVDGLFGIGLNRPLEGAWLELIAAVNGSGRPVVAVDVPSGLSAERGDPMGTAIRAQLTLTLGAVKLGLIRPVASDYVGRLEVVPDIGLVPLNASVLNAIASGLDTVMLWTEPADFHDFPPPRRVESNKGTYGHALIYAGSTGFHGAAVLAMRGALRARPGLVTLYTQPEAYMPVASQCQSAMVHPWHAGQPSPANTSAILIGPGLAGTGARTAMETELLGVWRRATASVITDASALDWLTPVPLGRVKPRVITPHPGEAARMLRRSVDEVQADRPAALRELARRYSSCWVVLKGHHTLVGSVDGPIYVNPSGNPWLAQGGAGDLLAGLIAGLLAQPALAADPLRTLRYAVWRHGAAADRLAAERDNWTIEDLAAVL